LKLTIGFDASVVASSVGGTRVYALQLLHALVAMRPDWTFVLYLRASGEEEKLGDLVHAANVQTRVVQGRPNAWRIQVLLPSHLDRDRVDVYHSLGFFVPIRWRGPKVVTVHDLNYLVTSRNWLRGPTLFRWLDLTFQASSSIRSADRIITDSISSREQITRLLHVSPDRVNVILLASDPYFIETPTEEELAEGRALASGQAFILFVGILSPQKNLLTLVRAYAKSRLPATGVRLVFAGSDQENYGSVIRDTAKLVGVEGLLDLPGFVSKRALRALYRSAVCVVLPSHGEGFGLPLVEGMASGTPILAANRQAIPEVLRDAGSLFEPDDVDDIAALLNRVAEDSTFREDLARRSRGGRQRFSWEKTAEATAAVYEEVLDRRRR
jgi:glycosyltransferase involved in cell wall biosynthesis